MGRPSGVGLQRVTYLWENQRRRKAADGGEAFPRRLEYLKSNN